MIWKLLKIKGKYVYMYIYIYIVVYSESVDFMVFARTIKCS